MSEYFSNIRVKFFAAAALTALTCLTATGCDTADPGTSGPVGSTTSSAQASPTTSSSKAAEPGPADYSRLLLQAADLSDDEDTFAVRSTSGGPNGLPGASALFVNADDTRAISDTIVMYPDAAAATATLNQALPEIGKVVTGGTPQPVAVGTDGSMTVGTSPDGSKATTLLLFTHGPAFVRLQFESAPEDPTTDRFVNAIGRMQQIALRVGLGAGE
ncbi:hypothetical protein [[Mycobacterium] appelbergii]|uniref:hypothetical protein n=1 Tax=[Mycobacterium] appelbergii TaxID=2939269 RepID=UPI0039779AE4